MKSVTRVPAQPGIYVAAQEIVAYKSVAVKLRKNGYVGGHIVLKVAIPRGAKIVVPAQWTGDPDDVYYAKFRVSAVRVLDASSHYYDDRTSTPLDRPRRLKRSDLPSHSFVAAHGMFDRPFVYSVGRRARPRFGLNTNLYDSCGSGIHLFRSEWRARRLAMSG